MFSGAEVCTPDQAGRLRLPDQLREYASIEDEAIIVGLLSHLEVWCPERWRKTKSAIIEDGPGLAQELREFGI
jgi:MraZ protein